MSGISGASASTGSTSTVGTNLAPITFPGIASGIDYNSIITKLTSLTLAPNTQYNNQITQLNAKNAELIKINGLLASVQSSLAALSDPGTFNAYTGSSTNPLDATLSQTPGAVAVPGSYTIEGTQLATATTVDSPSGVGVALNVNTALVSAGTAITPTNGNDPQGRQGQITVDGVSIAYDVGSQSLSTIVANIYAAVHTAAVDPGFQISVNSSGLVSISSSDQQISLGIASDRGNLESVLKLDVAQIDNSGPPNSVISAGPIGGVNAGTTLSAAGNAGFATAITTGTFTINGLPISVNASTDNVTSILAKINSSTAGVVASYNLTSGTFSLVNSTTGSQSIVVGSAADTSNFLRAAQLTPASGASTAVGRQAYVSVLTAGGTLQTIFSNSDSVAGAIPGMNVNVTGTTSAPFSVNVAQSSGAAITAITNFVSAYNAALSEIALATAPPVVQQKASTATSLTATSSVLASGGVLYGDQTIQTLANRLTNMVSSINPDTGSAYYNSLASIGLSLDTSHTVYSSTTNAQNGSTSPSTTGPVAVTSADGTDGQFTALNIATFSAAFAADPRAVAKLFTSTGALTNAANSTPVTSGLSYQLGSFLTGVTGNPMSLVNGLVGTIPIVALLQGDENTATAQITSLNQSIKDVTDKANAQADLLRKEATASEALVAKYQSEQSAVNQLSGSSSTSS